MVFDDLIMILLLVVSALVGTLERGLKILLVVNWNLIITIEEET